MQKNQKVAKAIADAVVGYLTKNKATDLLGDVVEQLKRYQKLDFAVVFSPKDLTKEEEDKVRKLVLKLTKNDSSKFSFVKDARLIDGIKIKFGDKVWDYTISGQLKKI